MDGVYFSVDAQTDEAGGVDGFGRRLGIPVHLGPDGIETVTLLVKPASG